MPAIRYFKRLNQVRTLEINFNSAPPQPDTGRQSLRKLNCPLQGLPPFLPQSRSIKYLAWAIIPVPRWCDGLGDIRVTLRLIQGNLSVKLKPTDWWYRKSRRLSISAIAQTNLKLNKRHPPQHDSTCLTLWKRGFVMNYPTRAQQRLN